MKYSHFKTFFVSCGIERPRFYMFKVRVGHSLDMPQHDNDEQWARAGHVTRNSLSFQSFYPIFVGHLKNPIIAPTFIFYSLRQDPTTFIYLSPPLCFFFFNLSSLPDHGSLFIRPASQLFFMPQTLFVHCCDAFRELLFLSQ